MNRPKDPSADEGDARLRAAFRAREPRADASRPHPPADQIWATVRGELPAAARRAVIDHTAACAACAEAWRMAVAVNPDRVAALAGRPPSRAAPRWLATLAAAVAIAVGAGVWLRTVNRPPEPYGYRGGPEAAVRPLLADDEALPRDDFRLRWSAAPGARYAVRVTTESLQVVADVQGLSEPTFVVPTAALASVPAGGRILWRVEVTLPDGQRSASRTFVARVRP
jgi:hypothetical protein